MAKAGARRGPYQRKDQAHPAASSPRRPYYTAKEVAGFCGVTYAQFRITREIRHTRDLLPRAYCHKPMRFDRASVDVWRLRFHPHFPTLVPANDIVETGPLTDRLWQLRISQIYGAR